MTGEKSEGKMGDSEASSGNAPVCSALPGPAESSRLDIAALIAYMRRMHKENRPPAWGLPDDIGDRYRVGYDDALAELADYMGFDLEESVNE